MRTVIAAAVVTTIALVAVGMLGVASAEAPTTAAPPPMVSVQGVATEPIEQSATAATATSVYRQGMAGAISDGQAKAQFLAEKAGVTLGAVQSIVEDGGYIECTGGEGYEGYSGEQPDFGSSSRGVAVAPEASPRAVARTPTSKTRKPAVKRGKKRKSPTAKRASATGCSLSAQVSLAYALS
jgi:hypothetical protein